MANLKLRQLESRIRVALKSEKALNAIGKSAVRSIKRRVRSGRTVLENGDKSFTFPVLQESTKKVRKSLKKRGLLTGKGATPGKSAVNRTGELIDSVEYKVYKNANISFVNIQIKNFKNQKKLNELIKINKSYNFMHLSKTELRRIRRALEGVVEEILQRVNINNF